MNRQWYTYHNRFKSVRQWWFDSGYALCSSGAWFNLIWCACNITFRLKPFLPYFKFFAWLVLVDRLNTKSMLQRRHINPQDDVLCVLCNRHEEENIDHLLFSCLFAKACWDVIQFDWDTSLHLHDRLVQAGAMQLPFYAEVVMIAAWELWKLHNDKVFRGRIPSVNLWFSNFKSQCLLQSIRLKVDLRSSFYVWLDVFS